MNPKIDRPGYLSYSQFTTYLACSWRYYLEKIVKVDEDPAIWFPAGTAIHSACDAIDHQLLKEGK